MQRTAFSQFNFKAYNVIKISTTVWLTEKVFVNRILPRDTSGECFSNDCSIRWTFKSRFTDSRWREHFLHEYAFVIDQRLLLLVYQLSSVRKLSPIKSSLSKRDDKKKERSREKYSENPLIMLQRLRDYN